MVPQQWVQMQASFASVLSMYQPSLLTQRPHWNLGIVQTCRVQPECHRCVHSVCAGWLESILQLLQLHTYTGGVTPLRSTRSLSPPCVQSKVTHKLCFQHMLCTKGTPSNNLPAPGVLSELQRWGVKLAGKEPNQIIYLQTYLSSR